MINEKERTVSKENYEISLKVYKLFKKYQNYETNIKNAEIMVKYNPDNLFKNRRKVIDKKKEEVAMIEAKSNNILEKIRDWINKILKIG